MEIHSYRTRVSTSPQRPGFCTLRGNHDEPLAREVKSVTNPRFCWPGPFTGFRSSPMCCRRSSTGNRHLRIASPRFICSGTGGFQRWSSTHNECGQNSFHVTPGLYRRIWHRTEMGIGFPLGIEGIANSWGVVLKVNREFGRDHESESTN